MRLRRAAVALLVATALTPASPASAAHVDVLVITATGTIFPGLGMEPRAQNIHFIGPAIHAGTRGTVGYTCEYTGNGLADSISEGLGTLSGSCGPISMATCVYVRVAVAVTLACADVGTPSGVVVQAGELALLPHNTNPTTSFDLVGTAVAAG